MTKVGRLFEEEKIKAVKQAKKEVAEKITKEVTKEVTKEMALKMIENHAPMELILKTTGMQQSEIEELMQEELHE